MIEERGDLNGGRADHPSNYTGDHEGLLIARQSAAKCLEKGLEGC